MIIVNHLVYSLSTTILVQSDTKMEHKFMNRGRDLQLGLDVFVAHDPIRVF